MSGYRLIIFLVVVFVIGLVVSVGFFDRVVEWVLMKVFDNIVV